MTRSRPSSSARTRRPTSRSLRVDTSATALTPLPLGNSDKVQVGDPVVAIGNPFGLDRTATAGIVSALQRLITAPNQFTIDHVIQTDAPINHGNSGGPLLNDQRPGHRREHADRDRRLTSSGNVGIGFAVPSNTVKDVVAQILRKGHVDHAYLGISGQPVTTGRRRHRTTSRSAQGVLVATVTDPDSGAAEAGLAGRRHARSSSQARRTSSAATSSSRSTASRSRRSKSCATRSPLTSQARRSGSRCSAARRRRA